MTITFMDLLWRPSLYFIRAFPTFGLFGLSRLFPTFRTFHDFRTFPTSRLSRLFGLFGLQYSVFRLFPTFRTSCGLRVMGYGWYCLELWTSVFGLPTFPTFPTFRTPVFGLPSSDSRLSRLPDFRTFGLSKLFHQSKQILAITAFYQWRSDGFELCGVDKAHTVGNFFDATNFKALALFDDLHKLAGLH